MARPAAEVLRVPLDAEQEGGLGMLERLGDPVAVAGRDAQGRGDALDGLRVQRVHGEGLRADHPRELRALADGHGPPREEGPARAATAFEGALAELPAEAHVEQLHAAADAEDREPGAERDGYFAAVLRRKEGGWSR